MSIPTGPALPRHAAAGEQHPRWCAGEPVCTAYDVEMDLSLRFHRGPAFGFKAPALQLELTLIQAQRSYPTEVFVVATVAGWRPQEPGQVGATLSLNDAERLVDTASGLLGQVR